MFRGLDRAIFVAVLVWTFLLGCTYMRDFDIWWHLRTGQLILERGRVPEIDWFNYVDWDKPWIDLHWGFQILMAGLYAIGGTKLLTLAKCICLTATIAVAWSATGRNVPSWFKALCWASPIICLSVRAIERPEMLSVLFLAVSMWILARAGSQPRLIWALVPLQILWVNCHGLFILGLVVGAAFFVERLQLKFSGGTGVGNAEGRELKLRTVIYVGITCALASLVNPYFEQGAMFPFVLFRKMSVDHEFYSMRIAEFLPPRSFVAQYGLGNPYFLSEAAVWISTAASFVWLALRRQFPLGRMLLFAAFSFLAWQAVRNSSIFAIVAGIILCANCGDALPRTAAATGESKNARGNPRQLALSLRLGTLMLLLVGIASAPTNVWNDYFGKPDGFGLGEKPNKNWYAHRAAQFAGAPNMPAYAFVAQFGQAAVYTFHNGPERRVFMDGRLEVSTQQTFERYDRIVSLMDPRNPEFRTTSWEELLRDPEGQLPTVILDGRYSRPQINGLLANRGWRLVYADPGAAVFLETARAEQIGLPAVSPEPLVKPPEN